MIGRFSGPDGKRILIDALSQQTVIQGNQTLAERFADVAEIMAHDAGSCLILQNATDNDLFFILTGQFSIQVNGREVARRGAGKHVGEMALIDPKAKRSASVIACEDSVVAKISEGAFTKLTKHFPELWRGLARELGDRLRQRNDLVCQCNPVLRIFIGSSTETLAVANEIQAGLAHDNVIPTVWTNRVFGASKFSIEALEEARNEADFAVLVLGPDDKVISRKEESDAPRDNVVFELGLFIGALGRRRVFMVMPRHAEIKIPTDLLGITPITYAQGNRKDLAAYIGPVCTELRKALQEVGPR